MHGLVVESPFVLGHRAAPHRVVDLTITVDERTVVQRSEDLDGPVVAELATDRRFYTLVETKDDLYLFRFHEFADVEVDRRDRTVRCRLVEGARRDLLPVILSGNVIAAYLMLRGELVLHASAVERDGRAVALVGSSGGGKSTLAAMACLAGARLVSDDVLRVATGAELRCHRGAASLRLRPTSKALVAQDLDAEDRSADGRHLLTPDPTPHLELPLAAVVVPRLRDADQPLARSRAAPMDALLRLLEHPRVYNWQDPQTSAAHLAGLAEVAERVPVYLLDVPWGVPEDSQRFERLADAILTDDSDR